ncbi:beta alanine--pyruvate transaminase protein (plasmid) [Rhizobium etli 8C-3]|uniref:Beta-alanine--pyruvate transaminase n=2 Tax=Rhizobium TaxID=379 RepID=A0A4R3RGZ3_9HYPH|nr:MULTISPECIES: aminotransferase class III-fold pyridoxal phosphate-dependent enzyme [Rhizobium]APO78856.1 beta alanine--pyruvate transaminase protein [Rhizobium etli 8C-3]TCU28829.1 beta-alanine--pyruvate transaminase [Rhizobium azibense]TCU33914.1 beta-alanine--pyruvate transaminase [Rhizobium azibense]
MDTPLMHGANNLDSHWMPFTPNRDFKKHAQFVSSASGMYYYTTNGHRLLDGIAGLWCVNAGHSHPKIVEAIQKQAAQLDFASSFGLGHPLAFDYANRLTSIAPEGLDHVFFTNSGSEAADTALKMALAYHHARGEGQRMRIIGRQRGYHGVGFGGLSAAGMGPHKKQFGMLLPGAAHMPHTHDPARNAFSRGQPQHGAEIADALEQMLQTYDPSTVAAVIVEPVAGSTGVLVPPIGYLERLREICSHNGILLILDEVVTGFGRLGRPFAADRFGVTPDLLMIAKGMTSGAVPMGGVIASGNIYETLTSSAAPGAVEFAHGYTYSGHPLAAAAGLAALDVYLSEGLFEHAAAVEPVWQDCAHRLRGLPGVVDIRNLGLLAGIELGADVASGKLLAKKVHDFCFEKGVLVRPVANTIVLSPPLIVSQAEIETIFETIAGVLKEL